MRRSTAWGVTARLRGERLTWAQSKGAGTPPSPRATWSGVPAMTVMLYARHLLRKSLWSAA